MTQDNYRKRIEERIDNCFLLHMYHCIFTHIDVAVFILPHVLSTSPFWCKCMRIPVVRAVTGLHTFHWKFLLCTFVYQCVQTNPTDDCDMLNDITKKRNLGIQRFIKLVDVDQMHSVMTSCVGMFLSFEQFVYLHSVHIQCYCQKRASSQICAKLWYFSLFNWEYKQYLLHICLTFQSVRIFVKGGRKLLWSMCDHLLQLIFSFP